MAATIIAVSCKKDNDILIVGTWKCTASTTKATDLYTGNYTLRTNANAIGRIVEFTRDGEVYEQGEPTLNYTVTDKTLTIKYPATGEEEKFNVNFLSDKTFKFSSQPYINDGYKYETEYEYIKLH